MKMYTTKTKFHCGIDLHKSMSYICVMDKEGKIYVHTEIKNNDFQYMKKILSPYWDDLTIACETTYNWYKLSDFCETEPVQFALGHALYMGAIHGGKAKNDKIDSKKITDLLRTNLLPKAYACPRRFRAHRDLLRRRIKLVSIRSGISIYLNLFEDQNNLKHSSAELRRNAKSSLQFMDLQTFLPEDHAMARNYQLNADLLKMFTDQLKQIDKDLVKFTLDSQFKEDFEIVKSMKGIGDILGMTLVYETHDIQRFKTPGDYASYCRVVKCKKESAGKSYGYSGTKMGNPNLKWAFGEIAMLAKSDPVMKFFADELDQRHGKRKGRSIFIHKICRAIYFMLLRKKPFDPIDFFGREKYERLTKKVH